MRLILCTLAITSVLLVVWPVFQQDGIVPRDVIAYHLVEETPSDPMKTSTSTGNAPLLHLPVEGTWRLIRSPGHEQFAFDLVAVDEALRRTMTRSRLQHLLGRTHVEDTFSWNRPVLAPVDGTVVQTTNDVPDRERLSLLRDLWSLVFSRPEVDPDDISPTAGNHVIIRGDDFYVFLAHLKQGSVPVQAGDEVDTGQVIGRVGNSGSSLMPHVHLQLFDQIDDLLSAEAPAFAVAEYERWTGTDWELVRDNVLSKGDIIRPPGAKHASHIRE